MRPASGIVLALAFVVSGIAMASTEDSESYYRYYYKQKIPMIADTQSIAVYDATQGPPAHLTGLLRDAGYPGSELRSYLLPGWSIAFVRSASEATPISGVAPVISRLIGFDHPSRYFFSPVFANASGEPALMTPSILVKFERGVSGRRIHQLLELAVCSTIILISIKFQVLMAPAYSRLRRVMEGPVMTATFTEPLWQESYLG